MPDEFSRKEAEGSAGQNAQESSEWSLPVWFLKKMIEMLLETAEKRLPALGRFNPLQIGFRIPETKNIGYLEIESLAVDERNKRLLKAIVLREGTDYACNYYMKTGSSEEIKEYLADEANFRELYDSIHELSDSVDEN